MPIRVHALAYLIPMIPQKSDKFTKKFRIYGYEMQIICRKDKGLSAIVPTTHGGTTDYGQRFAHLYSGKESMFVVNIFHSKREALTRFMDRFS